MSLEANNISLWLTWKIIFHIQVVLLFVMLLVVVNTCCCKIMNKIVIRRCQDLFNFLLNHEQWYHNHAYVRSIALDDQRKDLLFVELAVNGNIPVKQTLNNSIIHCLFITFNYNPVIVLHGV